MLKVLQHNCRRSGDAFTSLLQWAVAKDFDCILVSEPPSWQAYTQQGYDIWWDKRVTTIVKRGGSFSFSLFNKYTKACNGDVQYIGVKRRGCKGRRNMDKAEVNIYNIYSAPVFGQEGTRTRPMEEAEWEEILGGTEGRVIIAGDFNSHSRRWDSGANVREEGGAGRWLGQLIDDFDLCIHSSGEATYHKDNSTYSSAIDLILAQRGVRVVDSSWRIEDDDEAATTSDHEVISWSVDLDTDNEVEEELEMFGWKIGELMKDQEKLKEAEDYWRNRICSIPSLRKGAEWTEIEQWADHLQRSTILTLNRFVERLRICARTKRWWSPEIRIARKRVGKARKKWQRTRNSADYQEYRMVRNSFSQQIREAKKECWSNFLGRATGDDLWTVIRYTRGRRTNVIPTLIRPDGSIAEEAHQKATALADIAFPGAATYQGSEGVPGKRGESVGMLE